MQDDFLDIEDETGQCRFVAWRCLICGEVLDPVIAKHRKSPPEPMVDRARLPRKVHYLSGVRKAGKDCSSRVEVEEVVLWHS